MTFAAILLGMMAAPGVAGELPPIFAAPDAVTQPAEEPRTCAAEGEVDASAPQATGDTYILPETGFVFTIPGDGAEAAEPLPPCIPAPVRPRNLDIFGFYAMPVGAGAISVRWQEGQLLDLPENDPRVASLSWGLDRPGANPLDLVNKRVNAEFRYVEDRAGDRWAPAMATLTKRYGDCEDLAILKLALLARAGIEKDRLFLVIVRDQGRQTDHAVAAVRWENRLWVLDNRIDRLQPAERVMDYVPLQSFSGPWAWTYGYKTGSSAARAVSAAYPKPGR